MNPRSNKDEAAGHEPLPPIVLDGYLLRFAQAACVALFALTVGLFFASIPAAYDQLSTVCEGHARCVYPRLFPEDAKALERFVGSGFYAVYNLVLALVLVLGFWVIGAILFRKSFGQLMALYASLTLVTYGTVQADTIHWLADAHPRLDLLVDFVYFVGVASFFVLFCIFPDGRFVPRWTRWVAVASITYWLVGSFVPESSPINPRSWPLVIDASLFLCLIGSLVAAQIYRYRRVSGGIERQQTKWVVWGFTVYIMIFVVVQFLIGGIFSLTQPDIPQIYYDLVSASVIILSTLLIPLSISVAILRRRRDADSLWNINLIINRTIVVSFLGMVLVVIFTITDTLLQYLLLRFMGMPDTILTEIVSGVVIALLVQPLYRRIEGMVNQFVPPRIDSVSPSEPLL